ncbi:GNAT family N-acetyltransferase [Neomegalonema sp.]|uniref:GNAT family N-acetyltransferase n=1 Tax=Neomegalonema sp. TaxID=2039713 RepID=UPI002609213A|nr:GNAT family N-acetyltransferase [Neomegalonema sp.]MDD2868504.1 GNAT family N-acetyltransferase [Neomegalonema sp.]
MMGLGGWSEFRRGRYQVRLSRAPEDVLRAQALRHAVFRAARGRSGDPAGLDADPYDALCDHMLVEETATGDLVCCVRLMSFESGDEVDRAYSAQWYDLSALRGFQEPMVEMGRFCVRPDHRGSGEALRIAWAAMTRYVDERGIQMMFGCSSFDGSDAEPYADVFALLKEKHLAPKRWLPRIKSPRVFQFAKKLRFRRPDLVKAAKAMPPLLRGYLSMGGWVSDHAVIDQDLNTLHVFTGVEVKHVPPRMAALLRKA